ncbi:hypothetical protein Xoosp13_167 [Xanthomonas phage Xoo-sp13]|nr:hypothetical protein Xoosp13_167 [Xanthomonas phage Xoo-sp13]
MSKPLNQLFDQIRQKNLSEDFQVGQAAQALHSLQKANQELSEFLNGPFAEAFKQFHNNPEQMDELSAKLYNALDNRRKKFDGVVEDVLSYITDAEANLNPSSPSKDAHREGRWDKYKG